MTETGELTFRRVHRASPELLFDCMTQPEHLRHFWGPKGTTTPIGNIVVDLRPGGAFETTMVSDADGAEYVMRATYVEVKRPERLVFTWAHHGDDSFASARGHETTVEVTLRAVGNKTELTLVQGPFIDLPNFNGHNEGWKGSFDKLAAFMDEGE